MTLPRRIVIIGSSTPYGYGDSELGGFVNRFRIWHEANHPRNFVYGLGIFGETTDSLIHRIETEAAYRRPHLLAIYPGFNDVRREGSRDSANAVSIGEYRERMERLIDVAGRVAPSLMMTGFPFDELKTAPYPGSDTYYLWEDAKRYTETIREVCRQSQTSLLDYQELWRGMDLEPLLASDGLHANAKGHEVLFQQLKDYLLSSAGA